MQFLTVTFCLVSSNKDTPLWHMLQYIVNDYTCQIWCILKTWILSVHFPKVCIRLNFCLFWHVMWKYFNFFLLVPVATLSKMENITPSVTSSSHSDHSPAEHNGFTMSSSSHDPSSPPPESNGNAAPNIDKKNKKKLSIGGSFTKFWKGNKKVKDNGNKISHTFDVYNNWICQ